MKRNKYSLEVTVFVCGAVVMIFELVGSRILGPYFGTSTFVWTSIIGVILGSLSLGYYLGGKFADRSANVNILSGIVLISALTILLAYFVKEPFLLYLQRNIPDERYSSVLASLVLFLPTSIFLGMVSPYTAKLKVNNLTISGEAIGSLYALSTAGSILGTFLAGFYLIPFFGTNTLLLLLALGLLILSVFLSVKSFLFAKLSLLLVVLITIPVFSGRNIFSHIPGLMDIDTEYNRVWIYDYRHARTGLKARVMGINNDNHSSMYINSDKLVNEYSEFYHLVGHFVPGFSKTLMIGGAGYSYPKDFIKKYPHATMDVVEIDPKVTQLAKQYFRLNDNSRMNIIHEDGRVFLNKNAEKYDAIFIDAFSSHHTVPYHMTTKEAVARTYDSLDEDGVVLLNIISAMEGVKGEFFRAEYATYKSIFPQVYVFPVDYVQGGTMVQNIILVALKSTVVPAFGSNNTMLNSLLGQRWTGKIDDDIPILTDDYAPVDYYISKLLR